MTNAIQYDIIIVIDITHLQGALPMKVGDQDKKGNILILGGWKADLYLTPEGAYLIQNQITIDTQMALDLYNGLNFTSLPKLPPLPKPKPSLLEGIKLPNTTGKILGAFESESSPGAYHFVIQSQEGGISCSCFGFRSPDNCWHYRAILAIGPKKLREPLVVKIKRR